MSKKTMQNSADKRNNLNKKKKNFYELQICIILILQANNKWLTRINERTEGRKTEKENVVKGEIKKESKN